MTDAARLLLTEKGASVHLVQWCGPKGYVRQYAVFDATGARVLVGADCATAIAREILRAEGWSIARLVKNRVGPRDGGTVAT